MCPAEPCMHPGERAVRRVGGRAGGRACRQVHSHAGRYTGRQTGTQAGTHRQAQCHASTFLCSHTRRLACVEIQARARTPLRRLVLASQVLPRRLRVCAHSCVRVHAHVRMQNAVPAIVVAAATPPIATASTAAAPFAAPAPPPGAVIVIACLHTRGMHMSVHMRERTGRGSGSSACCGHRALGFCSAYHLGLSCGGGGHALCYVVRSLRARRGVCAACAGMFWSSFSPRLALRRLRSRLMLRCRLLSDERPRPPPMFLPRASEVKTNPGDCNKSAQKGLMCLVCPRL